MRNVASAWMFAVATLALASEKVSLCSIPGSHEVGKRVSIALANVHIPCLIGGSRGYGVDVPRECYAAAKKVITDDAAEGHYDVVFSQAPSGPTPPDADGVTPVYGNAASYYVNAVDYYFKPGWVNDAPIDAFDFKDSARKAVQDRLMYAIDLIQQGAARTYCDPKAAVVTDAYLGFDFFGAMIESATLLPSDDIDDEKYKFLNSSIILRLAKHALETPDGDTTYLQLEQLAIKHWWETTQRLAKDSKGLTEAEKWLQQTPALMPPLEAQVAPKSHDDRSKLHEAMRRVAFVALEILKYRSKHHEVPDTLPDLGAPAIDPFTGNTLIYWHRKGSDAFGVMSVGEGGVALRHHEIATLGLTFDDWKPRGN